MGMFTGMFRIAVLLTIGLVVSASSQCIEIDPLQPQRSVPLYLGQQKFSLALLDTALKASPKESVFFSPHSIYHALLLAYFSSANHTEKSLKTVLNIPVNTTKAAVLLGYKLNRGQLERRVNKTYEFSSADHLFVAESTRISECLMDVLQGEIKPLDFVNHTQESLDHINTWVSNQTHGQITDLLPPDAITPATNLVLANAAYFKGQWFSKFKPEDTKKEIFYESSTNQTFVDMMKQSGTFMHTVSQSLGAHMLELPYNGDDISMIILLPPFVSPDGLDQLLGKLTAETLYELLQGEAADERTVQVQIPKFTVEKTMKIKEVLQDMGIGDLFDSTSDLTSLAPDGDVHLDDAIHKAKIEVDENGSVAAAATALFSFRSSRPLEPAQFVCNHPFVYMLYDRQLKSILFMGVYRGPNK